MPIPIALPSPQSRTTSTAPPHITSPTTPDAFLPVTPPELDQWLNDPETLILDIRPSTLYCSARVPGAVSLSAPSTLLKRPSFPLRSISNMLSARSAKRFSTWPSAKRILVYDADTAAIPENSSIYGLLRKFQNDNFKGQLAWLRGGFHSVWRERKELVDVNPPTPDAEDDDVVAESSYLGQPSMLRPRLLSTQAFNVSSTVLNNPFQSSSKRGTLQLKNPQPSTSSTQHPAVNPFFDTIRQNVELSHGITERIPLQLPYRVRRRLDDLQSLPWLQRIAKRAGKSSLRSHPQSSDPSSDDSTDGASPGDSYANALATQFYEIELAEQRRLMGIMQHHSKESGVVVEASCGSSSTSAVFPFSITAGVEKGAKNRYRHIWPFEHARVKLHQKDDDYVNASYVQPLFTSKRYIATQGPLPATYRDFWTLCWEQNVHVIVMLTREVEGVMVKCGSYWSDHEYGPLRLRLVSTTGMPKEKEEEPSGFFSAHASYPARPPTQAPSTKAPQKPQHFRKEETVKRVFELTHTGYPGAKPRTIVHLQYLDWPDMNVPDDARGVLGLIKQVEEAVAETKGDDTLPALESGEIDSRTGIEMQALKAESPVLLHCSAGVGRTGGFIAVDAILDAIRREVREKDQLQSLGDSMDVQYDGSGSGPPPPLTTEDPLVSSMDMEVDEGQGVPTAQVKTQTDFSAPSFAAPYRDTQQWAEKVGEETRYGENDQHGEDAGHPPEAAPLSSVDSISAVSRSSSSDGSSLERDTPSSLEVRGSSSLGTSISSGTRPSLHDKLGLGARHRERTSSAPAPTATIKSSLRRIGVPPSLSLGLGQLQPAAASSTPAFSNVPTAPHSMSPATSIAPLPPTSSSTQRHFLDSAPRSPTNSHALDRTPANPKCDPSQEPRPLHKSDTPLPLSASKDPIWDVIMDMREQRMSLCQSLRQYVFVHMAVIEGALMVLDEERDLAMGKGGDAFESTIDPTRLRDRLVQPKTAPSRMATQGGYRVPHSRSSSVSSRRYTPHHSNQNSPSRRRSKGSSSRRQSPSPPESFSSSTRAAGFPIPPLMFQQALSMESATASSAASHGKRSASPTELTKEGMQGQVLMSKRPSMKRKRGTERGCDDTEPNGSELGLDAAAAAAATPSTAAGVAAPSVAAGVVAPSAAAGVAAPSAA